MIELDAPTLTRTRQISPSRSPRLGFLGLGWIGRHRFSAVAHSNLAEICALADPQHAATAEAAEAAPGAVQVSELEELLELDLDGIVIATPSALHAAQTIAALEHGLAVFCQKPLARTASETQRVLDAARAANRLLAVDFSYRFTRAVRAVRDLIQSGELGKINAVEMVFHNAYGPDKAWFYEPELSGGGCLIDLGTHLVDIALWCLDFPPIEKVYGNLLANGQPLSSPGSEVEDFAAAQLQLRGGTIVQLACSWKARAGCDARIEAHFYGAKGGAAVRNVNGSFHDFVAEHFLPDRSHRLLVAPPDDWGGRAVVAWTRRLADDNTFDPEVEHVRDVAEVLDAIYSRNL
jgi:predicted dehydrogenase